ncbi:MAG: GIY-YIG nuclease family protein [Patescibacteria group bacterium]
MYYLYILLSLKDKKFYIGVTDDLRRRIKEHNLGKVKSTKNRRPLKLIYYEAYLLKSDALRREKFLKTTEGKRLLRQQIRDYINFVGGSPYHSIGCPVG